MSTNKFSLKKLIKSPYPNNLGWRLASLVFFGLLLAGAIGTVNFVYVNIYNTLNNVYTIVTMGSNLEMNVLNLPLYEKTQQTFQQKNTPVDIPTDMRNIFEFYTPPTSTTSTANKINGQ
jgi:hypothetical protein